LRRGYRPPPGMSPSVLGRRQASPPTPEGADMGVCGMCGNDYDKSFTVTTVEGLADRR